MNAIYSVRRMLSTIFLDFGKFFFGCDKGSVEGRGGYFVKIFTSGVVVAVGICSACGV